MGCKDKYTSHLVYSRLSSTRSIFQHRLHLYVFSNDCQNRHIIENSLDVILISASHLKNTQ